MTDVLVRNVPDEVISALDARAASLGLSRSDYLRQRLAQEAMGSTQPVTAMHLVACAETFADLGDPEVMTGAWQ